MFLDFPSYQASTSNIRSKTVQKSIIFRSLFRHNLYNVVTPSIMNIILSLHALIQALLMPNDPHSVFLSCDVWLPCYLAFTAKPLIIFLQLFFDTNHPSFSANSSLLIVAWCNTLSYYYNPVFGLVWHMWWQLWLSYCQSYAFLDITLPVGCCMLLFVYPTKL